MLVIQRIRTEWTKESRGGKPATIRNAVPLTLTLPEFECTSGYILHDARFAERKGFQCDDSLINAELIGVVQVGPVSVYSQCGNFKARFAWSFQECGMPERLPHDVFQLSVGEWGQFICNGRTGRTLTSGREWIYQQSVFNIAHVADWQHNLFTDSRPDFSSSQMSTL